MKRGALQFIFKCGQYLQKYLLEDKCLINNFRLIVRKAIFPTQQEDGNYSSRGGVVG